MIKYRNEFCAGIQSLEMLIGSWGPELVNKTQASFAEIKLIKLQPELLPPHLEKIDTRLEKMESVLMKYKFLLIGEKAESQWPLVLERALFSLGKLQIMSEQEVLQTVVQSYYDAIIIDAGAVNDAVRLVSLLREQQPEARIVVATASPTWQRAREILQAGAADYIHKSLDEKQLQSEIRAVLGTPQSR
jgi:CheY-like chemotaxis protein